VSAWCRERTCASPFAGRRICPPRPPWHAIGLLVIMAPPRDRGPLHRTGRIWNKCGLILCGLSSFKPDRPGLPSGHSAASSWGLDTAERAGGPQGDLALGDSATCRSLQGFALSREFLLADSVSTCHSRPLQHGSQIHARN